MMWGLEAERETGSGSRALKSVLYGKGSRCGSEKCYPRGGIRVRDSMGDRSGWCFAVEEEGGVRLVHWLGLLSVY